MPTEQYLDELVAPPAEQVGELMILTGDGERVPLVKPDLTRVPIFDTGERRGNRPMATFSRVFLVDRYVREPGDGRLQFNLRRPVVSASFSRISTITQS